MIENKKSNSFEEANIMQIKYYLYILKAIILDG
ncbi:MULTISPECIES: Dna2/Cas4 domain-containing protein [Oceanotoga]